MAKRLVRKKQLDGIYQIQTNQQLTNAFVGFSQIQCSANVSDKVGSSNLNVNTVVNIKKPVAYLEAQKGTNTNTIANTNSMFCKCTGQSRRLSHVCLLVCARGEVCTLPSSWNIQYHRKYLCSYIFSICIYFCFSICVLVCRCIT